MCPHFNEMPLEPNAWDKKNNPKEKNIPAARSAAGMKMWRDGARRRALH